MQNKANLNKSLKSSGTFKRQFEGGFYETNPKSSLLNWATFSILNAEPAQKNETNPNYLDPKDFLYSGFQTSDCWLLKNAAWHFVQTNPIMNFTKLPYMIIDKRHITYDIVFKTQKNEPNSCPKLSAAKSRPYVGTNPTLQQISPRYGCVVQNCTFLSYSPLL
jgi:hypothetical protein